MRLFFATRGLALLALLSAGCGRTEALAPPLRCPRQSNGSSPLRLTTSGSLQLSWNIDTCVPVTISASVGRHRVDVESALAAWTAPTCTGLCFGVPTTREDAPTTVTDRRLHVVFDPSSNNEWALASDPLTGEIVYGTIWVGNASTEGDVLRQLGQVLGFVPQPTLDSVLSPVGQHSTVTMISSADEKSICATYPACL